MPKKVTRKDKNGIVLKTSERQLPNGKYELRYVDQKGVRRSKTKDTLKELREFQKQVIKDELDGIQTGKTSMTLNAVYANWKSLKRGLRATTFSNYTYMYDKFVANSLGKQKLKDIKRSDVKRFYNNLVDKQGLQVNTLDSIHNVVHQVFDVAVDDDIIRYNPSDDALKELKKGSEKTKKHPLTIDEQERFIEFLETSEDYKQWYPIFYTMLHTGMRVGEITGLRWCDVDFTNHEISVNHTLVYYKDNNTKADCAFTINKTKTVAGFRTIPIDDKIISALELQREYNKKHPCNVEIDGYTDFIFVNRFGNVQHQGTLNKALRERIIKYANEEAMKDKKVLLPRFSCHILRHTFCTNLCRSGVDIPSIMAIMGHNDVATTMGIYAEATKDMKIKATMDYRQYLASSSKTSSN